MKLSGVIRFLSHFGSTEPAAIFIFISIRQDQKKKFPDRNGTSAIWAVKLRGLKVLEIL